MKSKRHLPKNSEVKVLQGQSEKLKEKLTNLKEQIRLKKQEKQMNKTNQSMSSRQQQPSQQPSMKSTMYSQAENDSLQKALFSLKMEHLMSKLHNKQIKILHQLLEANEEQIDSWKDIPVGYRIKLKKFIEKERQKMEEKKQKETPETKGDVKEQRDIEQIIKERKTEQVFVALERQSEVMQDVLEHSYQQELEEQEQQKMMLSLFQAFGNHPRKSCLKNSPRKAKKKVRWSKQVDEMEKKSHKTTRYPKQTISKEVFHGPKLIQESVDVSLSTDRVKEESNRHNNQTKFCWKCLKRVGEDFYTCAERIFCSQTCFDHYEASVNLNPKPFYDSGSAVANVVDDMVENDEKIEEIDLSMN